MNNWVLLQEWKKKQMNRPGSPRPDHTHGIIRQTTEWCLGSVGSGRSLSSARKGQQLTFMARGATELESLLTAHAKINSEWLKHVNERQSYDILEYREKSLRPQHRRISFKNAEKM